MFTSTKSEKITQLLNEWYIEIRSRRIGNANRLKEQIDVKINKLRDESGETVQDQNLLLYYSLLNFRYNYLIDNLGVSKESFDKIESFEIPTDNFLSYYYHFFKAIHSDTIGNYILAKDHYYKAESLLQYIPDELEKAEFHYKLGYSYYDNQQALQAIKEVTKAKDMFSKHSGYEVNVAFCNNILGLACINLKEWELAEEHFTAAMDQFQKIREEKFILMVRHNLGWMYSNQNLSPLAIRYLSEVVEKSPNHYKAIFAKALEHYKLKETDIAGELIERGLKISNELKQEEFQHRYMILREMNNNSPAKTLAKVVLAGIEYFEREELYENVQEHYESLAIKFYEEDQHSEASKYFYLGLQAKKKAIDKGGLK
ncbi:tetratricopeptide repeat protein [Bacillus sp. DX1.1]|uniref:response regulator aspartate phosphatase n=1 Tax=unclassified Bacillus (in: firmicutes) TaxID=185979 RepID=UPI00256FC2E4|nr:MULTISPECIES: tetratricopeptide repeat protein [unclassified Bacillus (in: firmicutes)]MDM5156367.1 tetratricopeptide repeat protein [Bacillus sp. DX1.1]WJE80639.1 tetratricopeptide repeat protein [Bacillus sp. DX3.1]